MRELIIALPPVAIAAVLFVVFAAVSALTRRVVRRRFGEEVREELADQANNLLTGVSATFAFFIGFAISVRARSSSTRRPSIRWRSSCATSPTPRRRRR
jgi:tetrahydromethanopterin S-methyltransferase subunit E